jgi:hypothetical protein
MRMQKKKKKYTVINKIQNLNNLSSNLQKILEKTFDDSKSVNPSVDTENTGYIKAF